MQKWFPIKTSKQTEQEAHVAKGAVEFLGLKCNNQSNKLPNKMIQALGQRVVDICIMGPTSFIQFTCCCCCCAYYLFVFMFFVSLFLVVFLMILWFCRKCVSLLRDIYLGYDLSCVTFAWIYIQYVLATISASTNAKNSRTVFGTQKYQIENDARRERSSTLMSTAAAAAVCEGVYICVWLCLCLVENLYANIHCTSCALHSVALWLRISV